MISTNSIPGSSETDSVLQSLGDAQRLSVSVSPGVSDPDRRRRQQGSTAEVGSDASYDDLTGLYGFDRTNEIARIQFEEAVSKGWPLSVIHIDVDFFKHINGFYGSSVGDEILQRSAKLFIANTRETDTVGRYGNDEFAILLPETGLADVEIVCERVVNVFRAQRYDVSDAERVMVTISVGVAVHGDPASFDSVKELVGAAQFATAEARRRGGNRQALVDGVKF